MSATRKILIFVVLYVPWIPISFLILRTVLVARGIEDSDAVPSYGIAILFALIVAPVGLFLFWFYRKPGWTKYVLANGKRATATVLDVKDTGTTSGTTIYVKLHLRIHSPGEASFETNMEQGVSRVSIPGPGSTYAVKYDPDHKDHLVILTDSDFAQGDSPSHPMADVETGTSDIAEELSKLAQLHKNGDLSDVEFDAAKKKLLGG